MGTIESHIAALGEAASHVRALHRFIRKTLPDRKPAIQSKMLVYGPFRYRYASGREGDSALVSIAVRKRAISIYVNAADKKGYVPETFARKLPNADIGKSCIRITSVDDLDLDVFRDLLQKADELGGVAAID